jgi:hypothetical protein
MDQFGIVDFMNNSDIELWVNKKYLADGQTFN